MFDNPLRRPPGGHEYASQQPGARPYEPTAPYAPGGQAAPAFAPPPAAQTAVASAQAALQPSADDENAIVLTKVYTAYGEPVQRITLRKPLTREIRKIGNPLRVKLDDKGMITDTDVDWNKVAAYIPLLSTPPLPPSTVDEFEFFDLDRCAGVLAGFFLKLVPAA